MLLFPSAKINLGLRIIRKRPDGFHDIESVLYPVGWRDSLEFIPSGIFRFQSFGIAIDRHGQPDLCERAYQLLKEEVPLPPIDLTLLKNIPAGAGLGGGSSDAAAMLDGLNQYFDLKLPDTKLHSLASRIGSDCPFFLKKKPAFVSGRGDELEEIDLSLSGYQFLIAYPGRGVHTAKAYGRCRSSGQNLDLEKLLQTPPEEWDTFLVNDFESTVFEEYSEIREMKKKIKDMGAVYSAMSGSGSAVYGIFKGKAPRQMDAVRHLQLPREYIYSDQR